jgi:hypothetical protein
MMSIHGNIDKNSTISATKSLPTPLHPKKLKMIKEL